MTEYREQTVRFGRGEHLHGVVTLPRDSEHPRACVVMVNAGILPRVGASRLHVQLARSLCVAGVASLRFDLSGIGESEVPSEAAGVQQMTDDDLDDALEYAGRRFDGAPLIGFGLCSGAHDLVRAVDRKADLAGVVLLDLFGDYKTTTQVVRHYGGRVGRFTSWRNALANPTGAISRLNRRVAGRSAGDAEEAAIGVRPILTRAALESLLDRVVADGPQALFVFTAGLEENYNYRDQFADVFPDHVASSRVAWDYLPEANHLFTAEAARQRLIALMSGWMAERGFAAPA